MKKILLTVFLLTLIFASCTSNTPTDNEEFGPKITEIKTRGELIVGSDIPYGIMEYFDVNGNPQGLDIDLARKIADRLNVELKVVDLDWKDLFAALANDEIDMAISSITITEERKERMLFSTPYFSGGQILISRANEAWDILELDDKIVGVYPNTTSETEALKLFKEENLRHYIPIDVSSLDEGVFYDLTQGTIDYVVLDKVVGLQLTSSHPELFAAAEDVLSRENYGVAMNLGNEDLVELVNEVIAQD